MFRGERQAQIYRSRGKKKSTIVRIVRSLQLFFKEKCQTFDGSSLETIFENIMLGAGKIMMSNLSKYLVILQFYRLNQTWSTGGT